jgi:hypothetical protein
VNLDKYLVVFLFGEGTFAELPPLQPFSQDLTMAEESSNALGLEFSQLAVTDKQEPVSEAPPVEENDTTTTIIKKEKEKPYVNPERVKTGGAQRVAYFFCSFKPPSYPPQQDKLTDEALQERIARIREQNEKIKQRRLVGLFAYGGLNPRPNYSLCTGCASR